MKKITMAISGSSLISGNDVAELFSRVLCAGFSFDRINVYLNKRKDNYGMDLFMSQISCAFGVVTDSRDEFDRILKLADSLNNNIDNDDCRAMYLEMLKCYKNHNIEVYK